MVPCATRARHSISINSLVDGPSISLRSRASSPVSVGLGKTCLNNCTINGLEACQGATRTYSFHQLSVSLTHRSSKSQNCSRSKSYIKERSTSSSLMFHSSLQLKATYTCLHNQNGEAQTGVSGHLYGGVTDCGRFNCLHVVFLCVSFFLLPCHYPIGVRLS